MKILIVTQYFWPESFIVNSLATELVQRGHEVSILTGLPNYPEGRFYEGFSILKGPWRQKFNGTEVFRVPILARKKGFINLAINYISFVVSGVFFAPLSSIRNIDVVLCYAPSPVTTCLPAIFIKWLLKKRLCFWVQDLWPESLSSVGAIKSNFVLELVARLVKFIYSGCDSLLIQSEAFRPSLLKWGAAENKIQYIPNWAEPFPEANEPHWVNNLNSQNFSEDQFLIGFAGNIGKAQDMKTLVSCANILKNNKKIKFVVVGDGSDKKFLDEQIRLHKLKNIITVGRKPYSDMKPFFDKCNALYVSLADEHIFSLTVPAKIQAYMSAGKPILVSVRGEGTRIVNEADCGLCCEPESPGKLAVTILKMIQSGPDQNKIWGLNGQKYFNKNFKQDIVISQIENHLLKLIGKS